MKLIDIRETSYGKVADVRLDNSMLSFSMPYVEFALLEKCGQLDNEEAAIESNIRFMEKIHTGQLPAAPVLKQMDGEECAYEELCKQCIHPACKNYGTELGTHTGIRGGDVFEFGSKEWFESRPEIEW